MKRLILTIEEQARLPSMTFMTGPGAVAGGTASAVAGSTKLLSLSTFPGIAFKKVSSVYELIGDCNGIYFETYDAVSYRTIAWMFVGSAVNAFLQRELITANGNIFSATPDGHHMAYLSNFTDFSPHWPYTIKEVDKQYFTAAHWPLAAAAVTGHSSMAVTKVLGVLSDADWGFGYRHVGSGYTGIQSCCEGFTVAKQMEFGPLGKIFQDNVDDLFLDGAGDAEPYMIQALNEFFLRPEAAKIVSAPIAFSHIETSIINGHASGVAGSGYRFESFHGIPALTPTAVVGNGGGAAAFKLMIPMNGRRMSTAAMPLIPVADEVGKKMVSDVLLGLRPLSSIRADGLGPGDNTPITVGLPLSDAVALAYKQFANVIEAHASANIGTVTVTTDAQNVPTGVGSFANVGSLTSQLTDLLTSPLAAPGFLDMWLGTRWVIDRAEQLVRD